MQTKIHSIWKKINLWLFISIGCIMFVFVNVRRLNDNIYANYEKVVDYGRVMEEKEYVSPVISVIFYADTNIDKGFLSTYFDHSRNYKKQNIKIIVVPNILTVDTFEVVEKLYEEIHKHNVFEHILLVNNGNYDIEQHKMMLQDVMAVDKVESFIFAGKDLIKERKITEYLQQKNGLVVILADLAKGLGKNKDLLTENIISLAQKHHYRMNVFDIVDTQMAKAVEKDYMTLFSLTNDKEIPELMRQKRNIEQYVRRYGKLLLSYYQQNIEALQKDDTLILPQKSEETYRLYDRGRIYVETPKFEKLGHDEGIVVSLALMARRIVERNVISEKTKIYILTDKEEIFWPKFGLEEDDGIAVVYENHKALLMPHQRPENKEKMLQILYQKARMPKNAKLRKLHYYKFKVVEVKDED